MDKESEREGEDKLKDAVSELLKNNNKKKEKVTKDKAMERTKRKIVAKQSRIAHRNIGAKTIGNEKGEKKKKNVRVRKESIDGDTTEGIRRKRMRMLSEKSVTTNILIIRPITQQRRIKDTLR